MNPTTRRLSAFAAGAVLASIGALATAATASATEPATPADAAQVEADTIARYGVYPLPIPAKQIEKFHLSKKQVKELVAADKLADSKHARYIRQRESHGNYRINTGNGYYGAYQFDRGTWLSNGGGRFARTANLAPPWAQDYVVYKTHQVSGWSPWGG